MDPVNYEGTNKVWNKPNDMTDDQCMPLHVKQGLTYVEGEPFPISQSAWKPTAEDLQRLNDGGVIYLGIFGIGHPVVSVSTVEHEIIPVNG